MRAVPAASRLRPACRTARLARARERPRPSCGGRSRSRRLRRIVRRRRPTSERKPFGSSNWNVTRLPTSAGVTRFAVFMRGGYRTRREGYPAGKRQARLGRQPEQQLASAGVRVPSALVPGVAREIVARVEQLAERHPAERRDREERRRLHLHREASLGDAALDLPARLAVQAVGRPGLAGHVRHVVAFERGDDRVERLARGLDLAAGAAGSGRTCPRRGSAEVGTITCPSATSGTSTPAPPQATNARHPRAIISSRNAAASGAPTPGWTSASGRPSMSSS